MDVDRRLVSRIADRECKRILRKVVRRLQRMTSEMQSGDDSCLKNVWDEVCVQVQGQESTVWDAYLDTIRQLISAYLDELDVELKRAIWLQTDAGIDWATNEDQEDTREHDIPLPDDTEDITEHILADVLSSAADWTNARIERYKRKEENC